MKVFMLCICVLGLASSNLGHSELKQQFKNAVAPTEDDIQSCMTENNVTSVDWYDEAQIMTGVHAEPANEEKTRKLGCTLACFLKKANLMENSNINGRKVHAHISREFADSSLEVKAHKIACDCLKEVKNITEECEKSFSMLTCILRAMHKLEKHEEHKKAEIENEETEHEEHEKAEIKENEETEKTV